MSEPFIGEVQIWGLGFTPAFWAACDGQSLPIAGNTKVFSVIGTTYGGDGRTEFMLPNMTGAAPMHWGTGPGLPAKFCGETGGENSMELTEAQLPPHTHGLYGDNQVPESGAPSDNGMMGILVYDGGAENVYRNADGSNLQPMQAVTVYPEGGGFKHENMQPFLALNFCIALTGEFPSRS